MKKCARAMVFARLVSIGSEPDRAGRRRNFRPRPDGGYSVDDESVGGRKTRPNDPQAAVEITQLDDLWCRRIVRPDRQGDVLRLIGAYCRVGRGRGRRRGW